jgi:hypothetical protein
MNKRPFPASDDPLAESLLREAQLTRPEFSEALHARLRTALHAVQPQRTAVLHRKLQASRLGRVVVAAASIVLWVGVALYWKAPDSPARTQISQNPTKSAELLADDINLSTDAVVITATGLGEWMELAFDENQWAGLDRDARAAMATVTAPLPFDLLDEIAAVAPAE